MRFIKLASWLKIALYLNFSFSKSIIENIPQKANSSCFEKLKYTTFRQMRAYFE